MQSATVEDEDGQLSSGDEMNKKVAQKKYKEFQQLCGDLLDPSEFNWILPVAL